MVENSGYFEKKYYDFLRCVAENWSTKRPRTWFTFGKEFVSYPLQFDPKAKERTFAWRGGRSA